MHHSWLRFCLIVSQESKTTLAFKNNMMTRHLQIFIVSEIEKVPKTQTDRKAGATIEETYCEQFV